MFYLLTALAMPGVEAWRAVRRRLGLRTRPPRWRSALRQAGIALGVLAGIALAGWVVARMLLTSGTALADVSSSGILAAPPRTSNIVRAAALWLSLFTLTAVLGSVEALRLWRRLARTRGQK
jgi:hypothetical protein